MNTQKQTLTNARKNFIDKTMEAKKSLLDILIAYDDLTQEDNEKTAENYPFGGSFDEWLAEYDNWIDTLINQFFPTEKTYFPTITIRELKELLNQLNDDTQIVVSDEKNGWWLNIHKVEFPNEDEGMFTLTFHTKDNFCGTQI